jgi:PAS domain S-box-containing protein
MAGIVQDITERKRIEQRFRATIESAPTAMVMIDAGGAIVLVNAQTEKLFGYAREELLDQPVEMLIPKRFRAAHPGLRGGFFSEPHARQMGAGRELYGLRKDGSEVPLEIGLSPVDTEEGLLVLSTIVDISERTRQAAALRQANEALERSNIELQRFAYVASHDLQTPMRGIASFVGLLQSTYGDKLDAQANDWIRRTIASIKLLQTLVRDLLEYSRLDAQARPFEPVPFRDVFQHAVSLLDASLREAGAEVTCGELPVVMGDRSQLVQLMLNLIGNGIKYRGADPPRIHVSAERTGNEWTFAVRDNGIGIAPRHHERIFEIFQRLHDQREYSGTGIGLAVCRRVVHRHGGRIWVESDVGKGSVFYFTIAEGTGNAL